MIGNQAQSPFTLTQRNERLVFRGIRSLKLVHDETHQHTDSEKECNMASPLSRMSASRPGREKDRGQHCAERAGEQRWAEPAKIGPDKNRKHKWQQRRLGPQDRQKGK